MIPIRSSFKTVVRATAIAVILGTGSLAAAPAFAQGEPSFNFSIQIPGNQGQGGITAFGQSGHGTQDGYGRRGGNEQGYYRGDRDYGFRCLTNREVRRGIGDYGFRRVEISRELPRERVELTGEYRNRMYSMRVDKCTGEVDRVERIRQGLDGGRFGLQFNFGN